MTWLWVWLGLSLFIRMIVMVGMLEEGMPHIETAIGRYFFLGMILPVIGDVVAICAIMYYGLEWAAQGESPD